MKRNVVLVLDADADTARAVAIAASNGNYDLRFTRTSREFFQFWNEDLENVAAIVLDVDPGVHGMAILEALDACENIPPVIVVSALEEMLLESVVRRHGAAACLGKPLSVARLARAIDKTLGRVAAPRCDLWGHPMNCTCTRHTVSVVQELTGPN